LYNKYGFKWYSGPWYDEKNIKEWSYLSNKYGAAGMIDHEFYNNIGGVESVANYSWNAIKTHTQECNPEYLEICDGIDNDCDNIYTKPTASWISYTWPNKTDEGYYLNNDTFNCGSCGNICYSPQAYTKCNNSICEIDTSLGDNGCSRGYTCSKILAPFLTTTKEEKIEEIKTEKPTSETRTLSPFAKIVNFFKSLLTKKTAYAITGNTIKRKLTYRNESKI